MLLEKEEMKTKQSFKIWDQIKLEPLNNTLSLQVANCDKETWGDWNTMQEGSVWWCTIGSLLCLCSLGYKVRPCLKETKQKHCTVDGVLKILSTGRPPWKRDHLLYKTRAFTDMQLLVIQPLAGIWMKLGVLANSCHLRGWGKIAVEFEAPLDHVINASQAGQQQSCLKQKQK